MRAGSCVTMQRRMGSLSLVLMAVAVVVVAGGDWWGGPVAEARRGMRKIQLQKPDPRVNPDQGHDHITFDPMVAEVERHREDREWESQYEKSHHHKHHVEAGHHHEHEDEDDLTIDEYHDEDAEHEEFLHDAGVDDPDSLDEDDLDNINIEERLQKLFPLIDVAPADGKIDIGELAAWELRQYEDMQSHRMQRELESMDNNEDGRVSIKEYLHDETDGDKIKHWSEYPEHDQDYYRQEQERFETADTDKDGFLDKHQLYNVLHPEESKDPNIKAMLRNEELRNYDSNKDGKIELEEWMEGFWHMVHEWEEEERKWAAKAKGKPYKVGHTGEEKRASGKARFTALDRDGDGALSADELEPIMFIMTPGEKHFAEQTARYYMEQADEDNDNRLTLKEMKEHKEIFYEIDQSHRIDDD